MIVSRGNVFGPGGRRLRGMIVAAGMAILLGACGIPTAAPTPASPPDPESIQQAWPINGHTIWLWTVAATALSPAPEALLLSTSAGERWRNVTPPSLHVETVQRAILQVDAISRTQAWIVYGPLASGARRLLLTTHDGGRHWRKAGILPPDSGCTIQFLTPEVGYCLESQVTMNQGGVILFRTVDGGHHWTIPTSDAAIGVARLPLACDKRVWFTSPHTGWALFSCVDGMSPLYVTRDGGATWVRTRTPAPTVLGDSGSTFGPVIITGTDGAAQFLRSRLLPPIVYRTEDGGSTWTPIAVPVPPGSWPVYFVTPSTWAFMSAGVLHLTRNAGRNWSRIRTNVNFGSLTDAQEQSGGKGPMLYLDPSVRSGFLIDGGLWHTEDGGRHWHPIQYPGE